MKIIIPPDHRRGGRLPESEPIKCCCCCRCRPSRPQTHTCLWCRLCSSAYFCTSEATATCDYSSSRRAVAVHPLNKQGNECLFYISVTFCPGESSHSLHFTPAVRPSGRATRTHVPVLHRDVTVRKLFLFPFFFLLGGQNGGGAPPAPPSPTPEDDEPACLIHIRPWVCN